MFKGKRVDINATDTLIGEGSVFEGKIKSEASLRIEGQMIGDIECGGDVTIGESGKAKSNIAARNVIIAGVVNGNVTAKGTLTITAKGQLYGNTAAQTLVISEGAVFQGMSKMEGKGASGKEAKQEADRTQQQSGNFGSVTL
ncbi:bactofilin family protein [Paenibacillus thermotolerans]|uniref:bactofilin family protein n=1 Tax=Paenibacillus thermotolerans TaxID=3027807 RepID=UPI002368ECF7|nr:MULTISPECIES: polymer-forming cytoskeletal protein [unclassified Paenibacillus]